MLLVDHYGESKLGVNKTIFLMEVTNTELYQNLNKLTERDLTKQTALLSLFLHLIL